MSLSVGAKTRGWIKNNSTGELKKFQFNPAEFQYSRGATYSEIIAPGQQYPITQFVAGKSREFPLTLYLYDKAVVNGKPKSSGLILEHMIFLGAFLPPETNTESYKKPPDMTFAYGYFVRKCVLTDFDIKILEYDEDGQPIEAEFTLTIRQVSPT